MDGSVDYKQEVYFDLETIIHEHGWDYKYARRAINKQEI